MKNIEILKNKLGSLFLSKKTGRECSHDDFWSLYKIINFHRKSMTGKCGKCGHTIELEYIGLKSYKKYPLVWLFSCVLWMSPPCLIVVIATILAQIYGPGVYFLAIIDVVIFHFWAMYYLVRGRFINIKIVST